MNALLHTEFDQPSPPSAELMTQLLSDLTSRTADDFANAKAAVGVAMKLAQEPTTVDLLAQLCERLEALAAIQHLLRLPTDPTLDLGERLGDLCFHMVEARFAHQGIFVEVRTESILMDARRAWSVLVIMSELLLYAHRRAFRGEPGLIRVEASQRAGIVSCTFKDDGTATRYLTSEERRLGRSSLAMIAEEIGGSLDHAQCPHGTLVVITIPPDRPADIRFLDRLRSVWSWNRAMQ